MNPAIEILLALLSPRTLSITSSPAVIVAAIDPTFSEALRDCYLIERELGRGGMATVYLAHDLPVRTPTKPQLWNRNM